jgi:uncharacterized protein
MAAVNYVSRSYLVIIATLIFIVAIGVVYVPSYAAYKHGLPTVEQKELKPAHVDLAWILSGSPVFYENAFEDLPGTLSGIWECVGPGKFLWHYSVDETIYILEGSAHIEYLGKAFTLNSGDSTRFVSGTTATWRVDNRVKKTFRIRNLGYGEKIFRRLFG